MDWRDYIEIGNSFSASQKERREQLFDQMITKKRFPELLEKTQSSEVMRAYEKNLAHPLMESFTEETGLSINPGKKIRFELLDERNPILKTFREKGSPAIFVPANRTVYFAPDMEDFLYLGEDNKVDSRTEDELLFHEFVHSTDVNCYTRAFVLKEMQSALSSYSKEELTVYNKNLERIKDGTEYNAVTQTNEYAAENYGKSPRAYYLGVEENTPEGIQCILDYKEYHRPISEKNALPILTSEQMMEMLIPKAEQVQKLRESHLKDHQRLIDAGLIPADEPFVNTEISTPAPTNSPILSPPHPMSANETVFQIRKTMKFKFEDLSGDAKSEEVYIPCTPHNNDMSKKSDLLKK